MIKYEKYKQSGLEWLGKIPISWEIKRIKSLFDFINRGTSPTYVEQSMFKVVNQATFSKGFFNEENIKYTNKISNRQSRVKENDILIASTGGGVLGKVHLFDNREGIYFADSHITILRSRKSKIDSRYYSYFLSINFHLINELLALGSTNQTELQRKYLLDFEMAFPSKLEQTSIAEYLDTKTQAIDKKINLLTLKANYYKELRKSIIKDVVCKGLNKNVTFKESNVFYINSIPSHWKIERIKDQFYIGRGRVIGQEALDENGKYPVYSSQTENNGCLGFINTFDFDKDLLTWTTDGANAGTVFRRSGKFNCTNVCGTLVPKKKNLDLNYVVYALQESATHNKRIDTNGAKIMNNEMAVIHIAFPPLEEQTAISIYLDKKTQTIDSIVTNISKQIETLKELRKTLINDVVTGKIKVTN